MAVFDLYSKRLKAKNGEVNEVYYYDRIPQKLRLQIVQIIVETIGDDDHRSRKGPREAYQFIVSTLCREYGIFDLYKPTPYTSAGNLEQISHFIINNGNINNVLDIIELSFAVIDKFTRSHDFRLISNASKKADDAIKELNIRFNESGVGFSFENGKIVRVDSQYVHSEVVLPALKILNMHIFIGAQDEFLSAHEHYRSSKYKECLVDCLKSFESLMKAICDKHGWIYTSSDTAKKLIEICYANGLIPAYWQTHFASLRSLLESGIPTVRNKNGGHGQGSSIVGVPHELCAYALHMTAATIVFLAAAESKLN